MQLGGIYTLWDSLRMEVEGAGAIGVGAFLYGGMGGAWRDASVYRDKEWLLNTVAGKTVVVVISGGNIDRTRLEGVRSNVLSKTAKQREG